MKRISLVVLCLAWAVTSAEAIVTSDEFGSHVVTLGEPRFGVNMYGVVMIGELPPSHTLGGSSEGPHIEGKLGALSEGAASRPPESDPQEPPTQGQNHED